MSSKIHPLKVSMSDRDSGIQDGSSSMFDHRTSHEMREIVPKNADLRERKAILEQKAVDTVNDALLGSGERVTTGKELNVKFCEIFGDFDVEVGNFFHS